MRVRLLAIALVVLAGYFAFGGYLASTATMSPENLVGDVGKAFTGVINSVKAAILG